MYVYLLSSKPENTQQAVEHTEQPWTGLSAAEAKRRQAAGQGNSIPQFTTKTSAQIIRSNALTFYTVLNTCLFILVLLTRQWVNGLFMNVIIANIFIGIAQEFRAKKALDQLKVITATQVRVIRDGGERLIPQEELVLGDLFHLQSGDQVVADSVVLAAQELEVDEALLTGESLPVQKEQGAELLSGSFAVSGSATAQVIRVGMDNYAQQVTAEAKHYKRPRSLIIESLMKLVRVVAYFIIPLGLLLFLNQYYRLGSSWQDAVIRAVAAMIGMIPEGLVLLTSLTLAIGTIRLSRLGAVVRELSGLEVLARVDVLCLDKTGTLTTGQQTFEKIVPLAENDEATARQSVAALLAAFEDQNATGDALVAAMGEPPAWQVLSCVPFSSARKWSGATFAEHGTIVLGAPETLLADQHKTILNQAADYATEGYRVVLAAHSTADLNTSELKDNSLPTELKPLALLLLTDGIRNEARAALQFFAENEVAIKVISGDNPRTVARVARQLGLAQADHYIDATTIAASEQAIEEAVAANAIFGRVTPRLKQQMVAALKRRGHTVAMTGDGVNDVLALRESDCSIVVASGSEAAKNTANILLVNSDFLVLPDVVRAGRQVINNLGRVASLFLNKTAYAFGVSLLFLVLGFAYPFKPIQQSLLGSFSIGTPAFFLALEPNTARVKPGFLSRITRFALPGGITVTFFLLLIQLFYQRFSVNESQVQLLMVLVTAFIVWVVLIRVSWPLTLSRLLVIVAMALLFVAEAAIFASFLEFPAPESMTLRAFMLTMPLSLLTQLSLAWFFDRIWPDKSLAGGATIALE